MGLREQERGEGMKSTKQIFEEVEEVEENAPCVKCGRTDLPLHENYQCAECWPTITCDRLLADCVDCMECWKDRN